METIINDLLNLNTDISKDHEYDVVVIGAGNGGLIAATTCASKGMKTLLIEQHNLPGGFASSFVRGRFEFEPALHELGNLGNNSLPGSVYKVFEELGIKVNWKEIPEAFTLVINEDNVKKEYKFPTGVEEFSKACERYEPGSYQNVRNFIDVCKDCYDAVQYIIESKGNVDSKVLRKQFPNYLTVINSTLSELTEKMKFSKFMKFVLESYWTYMGVLPNKLSALIYCIMFYEYIKFGAYIPTNRSHEISQNILNRYSELGGQSWFNTKALKIDVKNNQVIGIDTTNGYIKTKDIISNASPSLVYGNMIDKKDIPEVTKKLNAKRKPGQQGFCVYLGLDKSIEQLGLDSYSYFIANDLDHNTEKIDSINRLNMYIVVAMNVANNECSEKGTSILSFTTLYEDAWNGVTEEKYFETKNKLAKMYIDDFEKRFNLDIKSHIEEIEIATPITFARYTGALNGAIYGYSETIDDSNFVRSVNQNEYDTINGLKFCGAHSFASHGYSITYITGNIMGLRTFVDFKKRLGSDNG